MPGKNKLKKELTLEQKQLRKLQRKQKKMAKMEKQANPVIMAANSVARTLVRPQIPSKVGLTQYAAQMYQTIALPGTKPPCQAVTSYSSAPTAPIALHSISECDFTGTTTVNTDPVKAGCFLAAVTRDPLHALYKHVPLTAATSMYWWFSSSRGATNVFNYGSGGTSSPIPITFEVASSNTSSITNPSFQSTPMFSFQQFGMNWIYVEPNDTIFISSNVSLTAGYVYPFIWSASGVTELAPAAFGAAGNTEYTIVSSTFARLPAFMAFSVVSQTSSSTLTLGVRQLKATSGSGIVTAIESLPALYNRLWSIDAIRVNGASVLFSPRASVLNVAGELAMHQSRPGTTWLNFCSNDAAGSATQQYNPISEMGVRSDTGVYPAVRGMYGFMKPYDANDFALVAVSVSRGNTDGGINLGTPTPPGGMLFVAASVAAVSASNPNTSLNFLMRVDWNIEIASEDQWFPLLRPVGSVAEFETVLKAVADLQQFHENKIHWAEIMNSMRSVGKWVLRFSPAILKAIGRPELAAVATAVQNVF